MYQKEVTPAMSLSFIQLIAKVSTYIFKFFCHFYKGKQLLYLLACSLGQ